MKNLFNHIPHSFTKPLLICAEYSLLLNYSIDDYERFQGHFNRKKGKIQKNSHEHNLTEERIYQEGNAFVVLSGENTENSEVVYCSKEIETICGKNKTKYLKNPISNMFEASLQTFYKENLRQFIELDKNTSLNKLSQAIPFFLTHRDEHMIEAQLYLQIHPYITRNLYFNMIIRPIPSTREYILLKENGDIKSATRGIAASLKINLKSDKNRHIKLFSGDLSKANDTINNKYRHKFGSNINKEFSTHRQLEVNSPGPNFPKRFFSLRHKQTESSSLYTNINEVKDLQGVYTEEWKNVNFYPLESDANSTNFVTQSYLYNCKISILNANSMYMKLVALEEVPREIAEVKQMQPTENLLGTSKNDQNNKKVRYSVFYKDQFDIHQIAQKLNEQINQQRNHTTESGSENIQSPEMNVLENNDNSADVPTDDNLASSRVLLSARRNETNNKLDISKIKNEGRENKEVLMTFMPSHHSNESERNNSPSGPDLDVKDNFPEFSGSHCSSKYTKNNNLEKQFRRAVTSKYYPNAFNAWILIFYAVIIVTFMGQVILFIVSNQTMDNLVTKKNLLRYAQVRLYRMMLININSMGAYNNIKGYNPVNDVLLAITSPINNIRNHLPEMIKYNKKIIEGLGSLDEDIKKDLFDEDIRIFGSTIDDTDQSVDNVTQFQAIDQITTAAKGITSASNPYTLRVEYLFNFILKNTMDDLIYKNQRMSDLFSKLLNEEKDYLQQVIVMCLIITPVMLFFVGIMTIIIIGFYYLKEKRYVLSFIKLNPKKVELIQKSLKCFERNLINEEEFGNDQATLLYNTLTKIPKHEENLAKREQSQIIKYKTLRAKYMKHIVKVSVYIAALTGILIANFITANNLKETIYYRQSQIQFANQLSTTISVTYSTSSYMFCYNNTVNVSNDFAFSSQKKQAIEIRDLQERILNAFQEEDGSYNSNIKAILLTNTQCQGLTGTSYYYCDLMGTQKGQRTTLIASMGLFENLVNNKIRDFTNSNKSSTQVLVNQANLYQDIYLPTFIIVSAQAQLIADIIDNGLTENISDAYDQRVSFLVIFSISMLVMSFLIYLNILSKLRETDNNYKKVLQVFPSTLILSSYLLKKFLKKTSGENFSL